MSELWVERHRPQTVGDIKGQRAVVDRLKAYAEMRSFPHLLFAGPPGTGKTTAALALTRDVFGEDYRINLLEMNASDERKLESIRTKVKGFAKTAPSPGTTFKVIFLDEADALTPDAQGALRRIMEQNARTCRFILRATTRRRLSSRYNRAVRCFASAHWPRTRSSRWSTRLPSQRASTSMTRPQ